MAANLHAAALVTLVVFSLAFIRWKGRRPTKASVTRGCLAGFAVAAVVLGATAHLCDEGQPWRQALIAAFLTVMGISVARSRAQATGFGVTFLLAGLLLSAHFNQLVHSDAFVGTAQTRAGRMSLPLWHTLFTGIYQEQQKVEDTTPKPWT